MLSKSYNHPDYPSLNNIQKIIINVGGYLLEPMIDSQGRDITKATCIIKGDFGGPTPQSFIKKATAISLIRFHKNMEEAMKKHYE